MFNWPKTGRIPKTASSNDITLTPLLYNKVENCGMLHTRTCCIVGHTIVYTLYQLTTKSIHEMSLLRFEYGPNFLKVHNQREENVLQLLRCRKSKISKQKETPM